MVGGGSQVTVYLWASWRGDQLLAMMHKACFLRSRASSPSDLSVEIDLPICSRIFCAAQECEVKHELFGEGEIWAVQRTALTSSSQKVLGLFLLRESKQEAWEGAILGPHWTAYCLA